MKHNGLYFRKRRDLGFRMSDPAKDVDTHGRPVESNYVSFVRMKDCEFFERDGRKYYNAENAKSIPVGYGGTYYGYGVWRGRKGRKGSWIKDDSTGETKYEPNIYWQCTVYLARDGRVYTSSLNRLNRPENMK